MTALVWHLPHPDDDELAACSRLPRGNLTRPTCFPVVDCPACADALDKQR